jgi:hypothetical protein
VVSRFYDENFVCTSSKHNSFLRELERLRNVENSKLILKIMGENAGEHEKKRRTREKRTGTRDKDTNVMYDLHLKGTFHLTITVFWDVASRGLS